MTNRRGIGPSFLDVLQDHGWGCLIAAYMRMILSWWPNIDIRYVLWSFFPFCVPLNSLFVQEIVFRKLLQFSEVWQKK